MFNTTFITTKKKHQKRQQTMMIKYTHREKRVDKKH